jgi:hypothetical protein
MIISMLPFLLACAGEARDCPDCSQAEVVVQPPKLAVDDWEAEILTPVLAELRAGITLWDDQGWGICKGNRECEEFLGTEALELPEGEYLVQAVLKVPSKGDPWKIKFNVSCKTQIKGGRDTTQKHDREFEVKHTGSKRGYPLRPLWKIRSPHPQGSRDCQLTLTSVRSDGRVLETWTAHYSTAAAPE